MKEELSRKAKNKIKKITEVFHRFFIGELSFKGNVIASSFCYIQVNNDGSVIFSPCVNKNYSTLQCLFLVKLMENNVKPIQIMEGHFVDSGEENIVPESDIDVDNLNNGSLKLNYGGEDYLDLSDNSFTVINDEGDEKIMIVYKDKIILKKPEDNNGVQ